MKSKYYTFDSMQINDTNIEVIKCGHNTIGVTLEQLSDLLGIQRDHIQRIIQRNYKMFDDYTFTIYKTKNECNYITTCLTAEGIVTLIFMLDYKRYKDVTQGLIVNIKKYLAKQISDAYI